MATKNAFNIKDKVFAKVKYSPAWPAIITNIQGENALQPRRYMIHFYGTYEKALCLPEQLFLYEKHKFELGKPKNLSKLKLEKFIKAIEEIENDLVLSTDDTKIFTTPKNIEQKPKLGVKKKFNNLSVSRVKKLDTPKINKRMSKRTIIKSSVAKSKKVVKSSNCLEHLKNLQPIVKLEILPKIMLDKYMEKYKQQKSETHLNNSAYATSCYTNCESLSTNETVIKPSDDLLKSSQTAKSKSKIKDVLTSLFSSIGDEQENFDNYNSSSLGFISPSSLKVKRKHENNSVKPKHSKSNKNISVGSRNNNAENNETDNSSKMYCVTKEIYSKDKNDSKGMYQENDVKIAKYSRSSILRKKIQNPRNTTESMEYTISNNEAEQNWKNKNTYSDEKINNVSSKETIIDLKLHGTRSSKTTKCLLPRKNVKTKDNTSKIKNVTFNLKTLSNQKEILQVSDQMKSTVSSQGFIVDAGSERKTQRAQPKEDDCDKKIENLQKIVNIMDHIHNIRSSLSINNPDYKVVIKSLLQIEKNELTAFAWKKNPDIVDTILMVSQYTGDINILNVSQQELLKNAVQIRKIAKAILEKIGLLFNVSNMKMFRYVFNKEVEEFKEKFKYLDFDTIHRATSEDQLIHFLQT